MSNNDNATVMARRLEQFEKMLGSRSAADVAEELSKKYDVKKSTLQKDWSNRDKWLDQVFIARSSEDLVRDIISQKQMATKKMWDLIEEMERYDKDDPKYSDIITALKHIDKSNERLVNLLQSTGHIEKAPDKHEIKHDADDEFKEKTDELIKVVKEDKSE